MPSAMNRDQLASRVSALIERLSTLRQSLSDARGRESILVEQIDQESAQQAYIESELERLYDELQQALDEEAYEDSYDDDDDDDMNDSDDDGED